MRLRRASAHIRLDMTPLIDVVFLLLTFFIFALVLMVRAEVLDIRLPEIGRGENAAGTRAIVLALDQQGTLFLEGEPTETASLAAALDALRADRPDAAVVISADERAPAGLLIQLADALVAAGVREFSIAGSPAAEAEPTP